MTTPDLTFANHGSLLLLSGATEAGQAWLDDNIEAGHQTWCGAIVVEPRYAAAIASGAEGDGLTVGLR